MIKKNEGLDALLSFLKGKSILILGFGREGRSSLAFLERHREKLAWKKLGIADAKTLPEGLDSSYQLHSGNEYLNAMADYDLVLKSPGISFKQLARLAPESPYLLAHPQTLISSQIDLLLRFMTNLRICGISGTKGKSTTTSLLYAMMKETGQPAFLRGNIGIPVFDGLEEMPDSAYLCLELSSHQLEFVQASPSVAALTNFYPEHLDHYRSFDEYLEAKLNILRFQTAEGLFVLNSADHEILSRALPLLQGRLAILHTSQTLNAAPIQTPAQGEAITARWSKDVFSLKDHQHNHAFRFDINDLPSQLRGKEQFFDAALAATAAYALGADEAAIRRGISAFEGLPHRLQWVRQLDGVDYFNDSIATIPQSSLSALETLANVSCLLIGGMDRGLDYQEFMAKLLQMENLQLICLPDTGRQFFAYFSLHQAQSRAHMVENMSEAVGLAQRLAPQGSSVLLSPAASSYHRYKDFTERGQDFISEVQRLLPKN